MSTSARQRVQHFCDTWNSQDVDRIVALFSDDAVMTTPKLPGLPDTFTGKGEIRQAVEMYAPGFEASNIQVRDEGSNPVNFTATVTADAIRQMGLDSVEEINRLTFRGDEVGDFVIDFTPDTYEKIRQALEAGGGQP